MFLIRYLKISIQLEVAGFDDATFKQQIEPFGVSGLISFNDLVKEYLIINKDKNTIIIK